MSGPEPSYLLRWSDWNEIHHRTLAAPEIVSFARQLHEARPNPPPLVDISMLNADRMFSIGLGRDDVVVCYQEGVDPPYYLSRGTTDGAGEVWFCFGMQESEFPRRSCVAFAQAMTALENFLSDSGLPKGIHWEEV